MSTSCQRALERQKSKHHVEHSGRRGSRILQRYGPPVAGTLRVNRTDGVESLYSDGCARQETKGNKVPHVPVLNPHAWG